MTQLTRRSFVGLSAAALAATVTGCSSSADSSPGLRVGWYGGDPVHQAMDAALAAWTVDHAAVSLGTDRAPFADYWDKLATQTAGGDAPDVFRMSMTYFSEYAGRGALLDLTGDLGSTIRTTDLDPDVASSGVVEEKSYGVGQSSISHALFVNETQLEALNLALPKPDWTWSSFAEFARGVAGETPEGTFGASDAGGNFQIFEVFARGLGSELFTADGSALAVGQEQLEQWFALWQGLRTDKAVPSSSLTAESASFETSVLVKGKTPIQFGWVQQISFYQPLMKDRLVLATVPSGQAGSLSGQFLKALDFWCVSAATKQKDLATGMVDFLLNDDRAVKAIGLTLGVPPSARARALLAKDKKSPDGQAIAYVESIEKQVGPPPPPWPAGYGELLSTFGRINEDIGFGKSDPAKGAALFVSEAQRVLSS